MGLYWRKSTKILPGVRINWSKSGPSISVGSRGAKMNFGKRGTYVSGGIPGTGLYYRQKIGGKKQNQQNTIPSGLYNHNANTSSKFPFKGCCLAFIFLIGLALLFTGNFITCLLYSIFVGLLLSVYYLLKKHHNNNNPTVPSSSENNSSAKINDNNKDEESIDIKIALAEVDHLISLIDNSTDIIELPSDYRKLMSIIMKLEKVGDVKIQGLPIDIAKSRIIENYKKRMNLIKYGRTK